MAHSTYGLSNMAPSVWSCCRQQTHELNIWIIIFCDTFFSGASVGAKSASVVEGEKKSTWDWEGRKGGKVRWGGAYFFPFSFKELLTTLAFPMPLFFFWTFLSAFWKLCNTHQHSSIYNSTTLLHPPTLSQAFIHSFILVLFHKPPFWFSWSEEFSTSWWESEQEKLFSWCCWSPLNFSGVRSCLLTLFMPCYDWFRERLWTSSLDHRFGLRILRMHGLMVRSQKLMAKMLPSLPQMGKL